jgi:hypothetical protein
VFAEVFLIEPGRINKFNEYIDGSRRCLPCHHVAFIAHRRHNLRIRILRRTNTRSAQDANLSNRVPCAWRRYALGLEEWRERVSRETRRAWGSKWRRVSSSEDHRRSAGAEDPACVCAFWTMGPIKIWASERKATTWEIRLGQFTLFPW